MEQPPSRVVHVEIHGQQYAIRSALEPTYVAELAAYVDAKIRQAHQDMPQGDTLRLAILAAINIADDRFRSKDDDRRLGTAVAARVGEIERLVDDALDLRPPRAAAR
jgi:cell division protein ZapA